MAKKSTSGLNGAYLGNNSNDMLNFSEYRKVRPKRHPWLRRLRKILWCNRSTTQRAILTRLLLLGITLVMFWMAFDVSMDTISQNYRFMIFAFPQFAELCLFMMRVLVYWSPFKPSEMWFKSCILTFLISSYAAVLVMEHRGKGVYGSWGRVSFPDNDDLEEESLLRGSLLMEDDKCHIQIQSWNCTDEGFLKLRELRKSKEFKKTIKKAIKKGDWECVYNWLDNSERELLKTMQVMIEEKQTEDLLCNKIKEMEEIEEKKSELKPFANALWYPYGVNATWDLLTKEGRNLSNYMPTLFGPVSWYPTYDDLVQEDLDIVHMEVEIYRCIDAQLQVKVFLTQACVLRRLETGEYYDEYGLRDSAGYMATHLRLKPQLKFICEDVECGRGHPCVLKNASGPSMQQQVRLMQLLPFAGVTLLCSMSLVYVFSGNRFRTLTIQNIVSAVDIFDILECLNVPFTQMDGIIWAPKYIWAASLLHLAVSNMWRDEGIVERPGMPERMNRSQHSSAVSVHNRIYAFIWSALLQDAYFLPVRINLLRIGLPYNPRILLLAMKNILFLMIAAQRYCVLVYGNL